MVKSELDQAKLESLLGRPVHEYKQFSIGGDPLGCTPGFADPYIALSRMIEIGLPPDVAELEPVREGPAKSGEIWEVSSNRYFLFMGRSNKGQDYIFAVGGDTPLVGHIISLRPSSYELVSKLFPTQ